MRAASADSDLETSPDRDLYNEVVAASFSEGALPSNAAGNTIYTADARGKVRGGLG